MEIWKDIKDYKGHYQVSNLGRVKSIKFKIVRILKPVITSGYPRVLLHKDKKQTSRYIHQLVAEVFLNHTPNGHTLVVNHINFDKLDNRVENLEIVTQRENVNRKHLKSSSQYTGVYWSKTNKRWIATLSTKGKHKYLGSYNCEFKAHLAYQVELILSKQNYSNDTL
jgi:hypothetical protein